MSEPCWIVCAMDEGAPSVIGPYFDVDERDEHLDLVQKWTRSAHELAAASSPFHCGCWVHFPTSQTPPPGCFVYDPPDKGEDQRAWLRENTYADGIAYRVNGAAPRRADENALVAS